MSFLLRPLLLLCCFFFLLTMVCYGQELEKRPPQKTVAPSQPDEPNTDPNYKALRKIGPGEIFQLKDVVLKRDAATFTLNGSLTFLAPVNGKVTGAVFYGKGALSLVPPVEVERKNIALLTKEPALHEEFDRMVLRFTDDTYAEIKKVGQSGGASGGDPVDALNTVNTRLRKDLKYNLHGRILEDVLNDQPGGLFIAFIDGKKVSSRLLFAMDPHGAPPLVEMSVAPEEIELATYEDQKTGIWSAFHYTPEYANGTASGTQANDIVHIEHHFLDTKIDKSGKIEGTAVTTVVSNVDGLRVVPFDLFHTLKVRNVLDVDGHPLSFIQEQNKDEDPDYFVVLPKPIAKGESIVIKTIYAGPDAVYSAGSGNYYPIARTNWYPNTRIGDYANYDMTFRIPHGLKMVATGIPLREYDEGSETISEWKTTVKQAVAGFNFGNFKSQEVKLESLGYTVTGYTNLEPPSILQGYSGWGAAGTFSTTGMMKKAVAEGQLSMQLYTDYFGTVPYKNLAITQQYAPGYGQSWPGLIYLPLTSFLDSTTRHAIGFDDYHGYFKVVGPHEIAHQWWGHAVGSDSYRDEWMGEGFADFSASLFLQSFYRDHGNSDYLDFWKDEHDLLINKNQEGKRPIDIGPVTLGYRLGSTKSGFDIPRRLIYPKGAYLLHMVRMLMWNPRTEDGDFKDLMKDFVTTYYNRPATTEDFKAMLEKHMSPAMNARGDGTMDWFFDEYVYGTALPDYKFSYAFEPSSDGYVLNASLTQSNVDDKFVMFVPIYLDLGNDKVIKLGNVKMAGNSTRPIKVPLNGIKEAPKRALVNYFYDVLSTQGGK
jgi:Peptidase family M1 domain